MPKDSRPVAGEAYTMLAREGHLFGMATEMPWQWLDIGKVPDFHEVNMSALRGTIDGFCMPGREVRPGVWMGLNVKANLDRCDIVAPVYIGGSAEIQDGARLIGPVTVGAGAVIETGAHVEKSVVMEYTRVGSGAYCHNKILRSNFCVSADGTVLDGSHTDTAWLFGDARSGEGALSAAQQEILGFAQLRGV